jgi:hypothetical protein
MNFDSDIKPQLINMLKNIDSNSSSSDISYNLAISEVLVRLKSTSDFLSSVDNISINIINDNFIFNQS